MQPAVLTTTPVTFALLAMLLGGCDFPEPADDDVGGGGAVTPSPPPAPGTLSNVCDDWPLALPGATPQALGAYCAGLPLVGGDTLGCVPSGSVTQCVDDGTATDYAVRWNGTIGTVFTQQGTIGVVEQRLPGSFEVALYNAESGRIEPTGQCSIINTTVGQQARFCPYLMQ